jgi:hypothetical protein
MKIEFPSKIEHLDKLKLHHLTVSDETLKKFWRDEDQGSLYNQRFIITVNDCVTWRGGSVSLGNNSAYITISKARMKELGVSLGEKVMVSLERDFSKYGFDVPEEFIAALNQDPEAKQRFESLTMGKQRAAIYLVLQLKSSQKRIEKSLFIMENVKKAPVENITMRHILGKDLP